MFCVVQISTEIEILKLDYIAERRRKEEKEEERSNIKGMKEFPRRKE